MARLFTNNASSLLAADVASIDTTVQVASGYGALFPSPTGSDYFMLTLEDSNGNVEVVKCTARSSDLLTVTRAQEGTTALDFTAAITRAEIRLTAETITAFLQKEGGTMTGNLDMDTNEIVDAVLSGSGTKLTAGEIVNVPLRGATGATGNQITVPTNGTSRAQAGGDEILVATDDLKPYAFSVGMIMIWSGSVGSIPSGWALCNGANGTPDLRDRFVVGAGSSYAVGGTGGATSTSPTTSSDGAHTHTAPASGSYTLTIDDIPAHTHDVTAVVYPLFGLQYGGNASFQSAMQSITSSSAGGGGAHSHPSGGATDSQGAHTHTVSVATVPPYYALCYIMYTG